MSGKREPENQSNENVLHEEDFQPGARLITADLDIPFNVDADVGRFKRIVRGKVREDLKRFVSGEKLIGRKGKDMVTIPLPQIDIPRFTHGSGDGQGVGQGDGEVGESIGQGDPQAGSEPGEAGSEAGEHTLEVELTLDELADILSEELELPYIEPKGEKEVESESGRYSGIRTVGPQSLAHKKRTYKRSLKRQIALGNYDPNNPIIVPERGDFLYRSQKTHWQPHADAVMFYVMDISGSMGEEQKDIARHAAFWSDLWLSRNYDRLEKVYIVHDAEAEEVDEDTFFRTSQSGGTKISSAYQEALKIIEERYPVQDWNIYLMQFSDGDNWAQTDTPLCLDLLDKELLPVLNLFAYGQILSNYGSGQYLRDLSKHFSPDDVRLALAEIDTRDEILDALKTFWGKRSSA